MATHPDTLSKAAALIEEFEGFELNAYLDPIGIPTICAGLTRYSDGTAVRMGDVCSAPVCRGHQQTLLRREYLPAMEAIPGWPRLGPLRQAVLLSFAWNLGSKFYGSSGFESISAVLKEGASRPEAYERLPRVLLLYVKAGGKTLPGLVNRRKREGELWVSEGIGTFKIVALRDTWLKASPLPGAMLALEAKKEVKAGQVLEVSLWDEIPRDSHAWIQVAGSGKRWAIYEPHWRRENQPAAAAEGQADGPKTINWRDLGAAVGKHITVGEVLCNDLRRVPKPGSAEEKALIALCAEFDAIREAWNGPLGVTSGYRPEPINRAVGGVENSYHVKGMALDVYPIGGSLETFYQWLLKRWSGGLGDGRNRGFIHIDTRYGGRFDRKANSKPAVVWTY